MIILCIVFVIHETEIDLTNDIGFISDHEFEDDILE